jgi:hypothetical protein
LFTVHARVAALAIKIIERLLLPNVPRNQIRQTDESKIGAPFTVTGPGEETRNNEVALNAEK